MKDKNKFIESLKAAGGIVAKACEVAGICRSTYHRWYNDDAEFAEKVDEITETQIDFVESKLMTLINNGDTTATIYYLKTKGRKRGWSEKVQPEPITQPEVKEIPAPVASESTDKRIKSKKNYLIKLLKEQGKYTAELSLQINITAQLLVKTETLAAEVLSANHESVRVEISREGNQREIINPKEKLYLDFAQQAQRALRALGMNTDSKERKTDNDSFGEFLKEFGDD